jgi:hypothetical protein
MSVFLHSFNPISVSLYFVLSLALLLLLPPSPPLRPPPSVSRARSLCPQGADLNHSAENTLQAEVIDMLIEIGSPPRLSNACADINGCVRANIQYLLSHTHTYLHARFHANTHKHTHMYTLLDTHL